MEERYNPMKSVEIATKHNYNMLDGVLNNQAPPPEETVSYTHLQKAQGRSLRSARSAAGPLPPTGGRRTAPRLSLIHI